MVWTARHSQCRPMSRSMIFHHQCSLARRLLHLWPIVQSRLQHTLPRAPAVSAHAESRILHRAVRRTEHFHKHCSCCFQSVGGDIIPWREKGACESLWASLRSLTTMNIPVWRTTCPGSLARSDPELQHFFSVFQHSPESRRQDTGFVFALRSVWKSAACPRILQAFQEQ